MAIALENGDSGMDRGGEPRPSVNGKRFVKRERRSSSEGLAFVMRTDEGRILLGWLFALNRCIREIRMVAGTARLSFDAVNQELLEVRKVIQDVQEWVVQLSMQVPYGNGANMSDMSDQKGLQNHPRAVFVDPACEETRLLGQAFHVVDRLTLQIRLTVGEWNDPDAQFRVVREIIWRVANMVERLAEVVERDVRPPKQWEGWCQQNPDPREMTVGKERE